MAKGFGGTVVALSVEDLLEGAGLELGIADAIEGLGYGLEIGLMFGRKGTGDVAGIPVRLGNENAWVTVGRSVGRRGTSLQVAGTLLALVELAAGIGMFGGDLL